MSDAKSVDAKSVNERLTISHDSRQRFQTIAYVVALVVVLLFCFILLFGILYPPPPPDLKVADWGASIVARAVTAWPALLAALGVLGAWLGMTLGRGAHDAALDCNRGAQ